MEHVNKARKNLSMSSYAERMHLSSTPISGSRLDLFRILDLPREIRNQIYFNILRPDCRMNEATSFDRNHYYKACYKAHRCIFNGLGLTKLLVLNRRIYHEAIGLLHAFENIVRFMAWDTRYSVIPWLTENQAFSLMIDQQPNAILVRGFQSYKLDV